MDLLLWGESSSWYCSGGEDLGGQLSRLLACLCSSTHVFSSKHPYQLYQPAGPGVESLSSDMEKSRGGPRFQKGLVSLSSLLAYLVLLSVSLSVLVWGFHDEGVRGVNGRASGRGHEAKDTKSNLEAFLSHLSRPKSPRASESQSGKKLLRKQEL